MRYGLVSLGMHMKGVAIGLLSLWCSAFSVYGMADSHTDSARLYAAYTYNLMSFTQWPTLPEQGKLTLCIAGQNRDVQALSLLDGKVLQGNRLEVVSYQSMMSLDKCQVLFIASAEYADLFDRAVHLPLLLLTNIMPENGRASMITLSTDAGRVVFDINLTLVRRVGLQLPPSLLKLARRVVT